MFACRRTDLGISRELDPAKKATNKNFQSVLLVTVNICQWGYWRQRAYERLGDHLPKVDPGAFSGQRQGWKTPRGPSGSALLLCV